MRYASFSQRLLAQNMDLLPMLLLLYLFSQFVPHSRVDWLLIVGIYLFYHLPFELSKWHSTPGKKYTHLQITDLTGNKPAKSRIIARNLMKVVSIVFLFLGFVHPAPNFAGIDFSVASHLIPPDPLLAESMHVGLLQRGRK